MYKRKTVGVNPASFFINLKIFSNLFENNVSILVKAAFKENNR